MLTTLPCGGAERVEDATLEEGFVNRRGRLVNRRGGSLCVGGSLMRREGFVNRRAPMITDRFTVLFSPRIITNNVPLRHINSTALPVTSAGE